MTITEFILARLDEDEAVALEAESDWYSVEGRGLRYGEVGYNTVEDLTIDPARVLAQCKAMRQIVELANDATSLDMQVDSELKVEPRDEAADPYVGDQILTTLAAIWSDHPDYDEAWRA